MLICSRIRRANCARTAMWPAMVLVIMLATAVALGVTAAAEAAPEVTTVAIPSPSPVTPVTSRVASILASRLREYSGAEVVSSGPAGLCIYLEIAAGIGAEGYRISDRPDGGIAIIGNDERGLLYGVGKFLRMSTYSDTGVTPGTWRGQSVPSKPVRGIYFATHFHNYYHQAPVEEITHYVEDLALWGLNSISVWYDLHHFSSLQDPNAQAMLARLRALLKTAKDLGLDASLTTVGNEAYASRPLELRADDTTVNREGYHTTNGPRIYNLGNEICPSKPGSMEIILGLYEERFREFRSVGIDYLWIWPYDSGGCTCADCKVWGANAYLKMSEQIARAYRRAYPNGKLVLSTWYFDRWGIGEWEGITQKFNANKPDWVDYIMTDNYGGQFPQYPLTHGSPGGVPMLNFPEISMYLHAPWGGYGAIPFPRYLQSLWNLTKTKLSGGFPYSEGRYEDMNKAMCAQLYWNPEKPTAETLREYVSFYFSPAVVDDVCTALNTLEQNIERYRDDSGGVTRFIMKNTQGAEEAFRLVSEADKKLRSRVRQSWRWRIVYLRALIDSELVKHDFRVSAKCAAAFSELTTLYHAENGEGLVSPPTGIQGTVP